jgi:hypothetical protein
MIPLIIRILILAATTSSAPIASSQVLDVAGRTFHPFRVEGKAQVLFFLSAECPISGFYAPEIQRICKNYAGRGVRCALIYEDLDIEPGRIRRHLDEFGYRDIPAALDTKAQIAKQAGATVTPQAVLLDERGRIRYRGRIDNFYFDLGKSRRQATTHDLRDALDAVISGQPVLRPETQAVGCYITLQE